MTEQTFLESALVYLSAAVIAVPLFKRLGLGSALGYLVAGMAIGPWGLKLISDVEAILDFSEFGVVLLMFIIGLELNPSKLWSLRRPAIGMGGVQVLGTTLLIAAVGLGLGLTLPVALIAGAAMAMSSTPIALQALEERGLGRAAVGTSAFAVLLFQDIVVVPLLALVPLFEPGMHDSRTEGWVAALQIVAFFAIIVLGGRFALRPIFRIIASTRLREIFTAFSLFLVVGAGLLAEAVGISMALGTFLAGVLLAESEYRHELELNIEPFKGLLLGLFFIAVGMSVDFSLLIEKPLVVIGLVLLLVVLKVAVLLPVARAGGHVPAEQFLFATVLSQGGEFAFVLISVALGAELIDREFAALMVVVATFSMLVTPLLLFIYDRYLFSRLCNAEQQETDVVGNENHVIIAGFGRFGQIVGRFLMSFKVPMTVVDHDPNHIEFIRKFGYKVFYGDAARLDLLESAGAAKARLLVLAMDDSEAVIEAARVAREHFPGLTILARARNRPAVNDLRELGVVLVRRETFGSALELGELALRELGFGAHEAHRAARKFRHYDEKMIEASAAFRGDEQKSVDFAKKSRAQLERIMSADEEENTGDPGWH
ncbi:glutathione-regulated potassium-efflux system protein KefC [Kordiimonas gwangyangensis]|uniref:glutathione-regulated potassium-efflux system protein KefC n=1 Tax=Kordiimonas gwangyangensis TaxID=288022 RepID=UPI000375519B|nr:glutathione-regulated potassium-efflux system protein KefC [Kordiimonas gwangyangensis]